MLLHDKIDALAIKAGQLQMKLAKASWWVTSNYYAKSLEKTISLMNDLSSRRTNLNLCYDHRQEINQSQFCKSNCDYCKILAENKRLYEQNCKLYEATPIHEETLLSTYDDIKKEKGLWAANSYIVKQHKAGLIPKHFDYSKLLKK